MIESKKYTIIIQIYITIIFPLLTLICEACSTFALLITVVLDHLLKLFNISVMVAASSILGLDEVGQSVSPNEVFRVKVLESAC